MPDFNSPPSLSLHRLENALGFDRIQYTAEQQRERAKSPLKKAEDTAYVLNHTGTCLTLDVTGLPAIVSAWVVRILRGLAGTASAAEAAGEAPKTLMERFKGLINESKNWWIGEVVGDLGAVPATIAIQRHFPGAVAALNHGLEVPFGPIYKRSALHETKHWALEHGVAEGSLEYTQHFNNVYHGEIDHLGDAALWTVWAFPLNIAAQHGKAHFWPEMIKNAEGMMVPAAEMSTKEIVQGKLGGALWATGTILSLRALAPAKAQHLDEKTSKHVIEPMTRTFSGLFGVDKASLDAVTAKTKDTPPAKTGRPAMPGTRVSEPEPAASKAVAGKPANENFDVANDQGWVGKAATGTESSPPIR